MKLATIGYEGSTVPDVLGRLKAAGVEVVVDVRAVAASRRPGFSKTMLAANLAEAGIDYVHLRQLGTPSDGRTAARAGRVAEMHRIFLKHMEEPGPQLELIRAAEIVCSRKAALLCYEADAKGCHRTLLVDMLKERLPLEVEDL